VPHQLYPQHRNEEKSPQVSAEIEKLPSDKQELEVGAPLWPQLTCERLEILL